MGVGLQVDVVITPGAHSTEAAVNKQLNDKERVAAALENTNLLDMVNSCLAGSEKWSVYLFICNMNHTQWTHLNIKLLQAQICCNLQIYREWWHWWHFGGCAHEISHYWSTGVWKCLVWSLKPGFAAIQNSLSCLSILDWQVVAQIYCQNYCRILLSIIWLLSGMFSCWWNPENNP